MHLQTSEDCERNASVMCLFKQALSCGKSKMTSYKNVSKDFDFFEWMQTNMKIITMTGTHQFEDGKALINEMRLDGDSCQKQAFLVHFIFLTPMIHWDYKQFTLVAN